MKRERVIISTFDEIKNPNYGGGGAVGIHEAALRLEKAFDVLVICGNYFGAKNGVYNRVKYKHIGPRFLSSKISQLIFQIILPFYVFFEKYDLWVESFTPPFSTTCLQWFTDKPVIGLVHMLSGEDMQRKYRLPFPLIEKFGLKQYRFFIVTTDQMKNKIKSINNSASIAVIPNGINLPVFEMNKKRANEILFLGRIEINQKGLDLLIEAYSNIARKSLYKLKIAGSGEKKEIKKLLGLIQNKKLQDRIELMGKVEWAKKNTLLNRVKIIVVPSRFETFSITALEAIASGALLVHFDISGLSWIPDAFSIRAKKITSKSLETALMSAIKQDVKTNLDLQSRFVKDLNWDNIGNKYFEYINDVLDLKK